MFLVLVYLDQKEQLLKLVMNLLKELLNLKEKLTINLMVLKLNMKVKEEDLLENQGGLQNKYMKNQTQEQDQKIFQH